MPDDPIEQLFVQLSIQTDQFRKDVDDLLQSTVQQVQKKAPVIPLKLDTAGLTKQTDKLFQDYQKTLQKSLGVISLQIDTKSAQKTINDAVKLFVDQAPKLQKAGKIDLTVQTANLKKSLDAAMQQVNQQISATGATGPGVQFAKQAGQQLANNVVDSLVPVKQATNTVRQQLTGLGTTAATTLQAMATSFAQTRNPVIALTTGIQALNVGLQAMAASGVFADTALAPLIVVVVALVAALATLTALTAPVIGFLTSTADAGQKLAAQIQTTSIAIQVAAKNTGVSLSSVNDMLEKLQATGVSATDSLTNMMRMLTSQVPTGQLDKLARAAQNVAIAFNQAPGDALNLFVDAITKGNTLELRQIGITQTAQQMEDRYATSIGTVAENLTDVQKKEAIMQGIMRGAQAYTGLYAQSMETLGTQIGMLPTYIQKGTLAFGQTLTPFLQQAIAQATNFWQQFQALFVKMKMVTDAEGKLQPVAQMGAGGQPIFTQLGQQINDFAVKTTKAIQPLYDAAIKSLPAIAQSMGDLLTASTNLLAVLSPIPKFFANLEILSLQAIKSLIDGISKVEIPVANLSGKFVSIGDVVRTFGLVARNVLVSSIVGPFTTATAIVQDFYSILTGHGPTGSFQDFVKQGTDAVQAVIAQLDAARTAVSQPAAVNLPAAPVEDPTLAKRLQSEKDLGIQFVLAQDQYQLQLIESQHQYEVASYNQTKEYNRQLDELGSAFTVQQMRFERDAQTQRLHSARDFAINLARQLQDYDTSTARANLQRQKEFDRNQVVEKQQFLLEMKRAEQDYGISLEDAVRNRDARAVINTMRQHKIDVQRKTQDFGINQTLEKQQFDLQTQEQALQRTYLIEDAKKDYARQQQDFEKSLRDQRAAAIVSHNDQLADLHRHLVQAQGYRKEDFDQQKTEMAYQFGLQQTAMVKQWADTGAIDEAGAAQLLGILDTYFGANGKIIEMMGTFKTDFARNGTFRINVETAFGSTNLVTPNSQGPLPNQVGAVPGSSPISAPSKASGPGVNLNKPGYTIPPVVNPYGNPAYDPTNVNAPIHGAGGLSVANRPTHAIFGDSGPEAALFLPMPGGNASLNQLISGGSGGRKDRLDVALRISSDGSISPEFEDRIYAGVAQILAQSVGVRIEGR